jgi:hypothetical protein
MAKPTGIRKDGVAVKRGVPCGQHLEGKKYTQKEFNKNFKIS